MDVDLRGDYCGAGTNPTNSVAGRHNADNDDHCGPGH